MCDGNALAMRGFALLWVALAVTFNVTPSEAGPFAYVANVLSNTVSVIDTTTNTVVATVPVGNSPAGVAVTPDGKHVYVTNAVDGTVSVIEAASNTVVATVGGGEFPTGLAITPDGKRVYVTMGEPFFSDGTVSVIDTGTNRVVATIPVGGKPNKVAITPDGKNAYVAIFFRFSPAGKVTVIDTGTNRVVATIPEEGRPNGVAITPDGKHAYVLNTSNFQVVDKATNTVVTTVPLGSLTGFDIAVSPDGQHAYVATDNLMDAGNVSVIDTATNMVIAAVLVGRLPQAIAFAPDGKHAYVANSGSNTVSVIDTAIKTVEATIAVGIKPNGGPTAVGIVPPPPGVHFSTFNASLQIRFGRPPNTDAFSLLSNFTLGHSSNGINPAAEPVTFQVGPFTTTIPPGSFKTHGLVPLLFQGVIDGVAMRVVIRATGTERYALQAEATGADLHGTLNPVAVRLIIGDDSGATSVKANIDTNHARSD